MREAYQSKIGQRIPNSNLLVHLNPNFRESGLDTYIRKDCHLNRQRYRHTSVPEK